ncbi:MAG TPA: ATPase, T2SS/T4P/T4SS family, partial [Bryobacteraceae bacterium]|nr:ATPase, T2SS/T4P/T4SS family [Bryobacteraceae bacterium]
MSGFDNELEHIVTELNRAAHKPPAGFSAEKLSPHPSGGLEHLLSFAAERNASDILLVADAPATLRVSGMLCSSGAAPLSEEDIQNLLMTALTPEQQGELRRRKTLDLSFVRSNGVRCRANLHYQRGTMAASIRLLPARVPSLESLHLPPVLARFTERRQGLVLVTGPTGCGKTSTLASLIELINRRSRFHIVTIEDPIEYQYVNAQSIV